MTRAARFCNFVTFEKEFYNRIPTPNCSNRDEVGLMNCKRKVKSYMGPNT